MTPEGAVDRRAASVRDHRARGFNADTGDPAQGIVVLTRRSPAG